VCIGNSVGTCNTDAQSNVDEEHLDSVKDASLKRPPCIKIVPDAAAGAMDADEEVSLISSRVPQLDLGMPVISVQVASPVPMSPRENEGTLCSAMEKFTNAWTGNFDIEDKVGEQNVEVDASDGKNYDVICQLDHQDVDVADMYDEDRPLSPTDYTLQDESDINQLDAQDAYHPMLLDCRVPSPSEFSLLTESAEENELHRLTHAPIPDDLFAIPDPSPSSAEMNIYMAMHYDQIACGRQQNITNNSVLMPGTNTIACWCCSS